MTDRMTTRQKQIPNRIDVLVSMRGDMSIDSQGAPLNGGKGDIHVEYIRADSIETLDETLLKARWAKMLEWEDRPGPRRDAILDALAQFDKPKERHHE